MGFGETVVAVVAITATCSLIRHGMQRRGVSGREAAEILAQVHAMRAELAELKRQNTDVILTFDTSLQGVSRRLERLEDFAGIGARSSAPADPVTARIR